MSGGCLLQPLHYLRKLEPVYRLDVKRHAVRLNDKMPHLARKAFPRFTECPVEKLHGVPVQKYLFVAVH
jgi:hypothetical protein